MDIDYLLTTADPQAIDNLFADARRECDRVYGRRVFLRGLVEISNHCRNNCLYCGIRRDAKCGRYRLTKEQILEWFMAGSLDADADSDLIDDFRAAMLE